nr:hypothetical protein [Desulfobulbaceae bacterium]
MKHFILIFWAICLLADYPGLAFAEDKTVTTSGSSDVSLEDAIRQAQRLAVEEAVGVFIQSKTEMENYILQKDKIISRTQGYVTRYDVLTQTEKNGVFEVQIQATVSLDKIKDDLLAMKILLESMQRPKLMILIAEEYKSMDDLNMQIAGTELSRLLAEKGFELVDKAQTEAVMDKEQKRLALAGNPQAASSLGLQYGAQYVVIGKAVAQDAGETVPGTGLRSIQTSLQLQVIQTQTAVVLGSVIKTGVSAHLSPLTGSTLAFMQASQKAIDEYLVDTITNSFQDFLNNGAPIKLHLTGIDSFSAYKSVAPAIENLPQISSSKKEGWNKEGGLLVFDLRFKGTSEELAFLLDGMVINMRKLTVTDFGPERLNCTYQ